MALAPSVSYGIYVETSTDGSTLPFTFPADASVFVAAIVVSIIGAPIIQVFYEQLDTDGNWQTVVTLPTISAPGAQSQSAQPSAVVPNVTNEGRLRWTNSGGDAGFAAVAIGQ